MSASFNTTILLEMAHLWSKVQGMASNKVADSTELWQFNRMAGEFPELAGAAKIIQFAAFDFVNAFPGRDRLAGLDETADRLARCIKGSVSFLAHAETQGTAEHPVTLAEENPSS